MTFCFAFDVYNKINQKDVIKNYLPNYGQSPSSHGYVTEVANEIKKYNCF